MTDATGSKTTGIPKDWDGSDNLWREFFWMLRHASWCWGRNETGQFWDCGRTWHDGPIWFAFVGPIGVSLYVN